MKAPKNPKIEFFETVKSYYLGKKIFPGKTMDKLMGNPSNK